MRSWSLNLADASVPSESWYLSIFFIRWLFALSTISSNSNINALWRWLPKFEVSVRILIVSEKVMPLEVDSTYHTECSMKQSAMDTGSVLLRTWHVNLLCCFPSGDIVFGMQTVVGILVFGRHTTCIALDSRSSTENIYIPQIYSCYCNSSFRVNVEQNNK